MISFFVFYTCQELDTAIVAFLDVGSQALSLHMERCWGEV